MAANANKVKYNIKNLHYSVLTVGDNGAVTFGTPVAVPGAVSISMDPNGDSTTFYADGIAYYVAVANNGYSGSLEVALFPDKFRQDVWGETLDGTDKVLVENNGTEPKPIALLFEFDGDQKATRHILYNCTAKRPSVASTTTTDQKEVQTETSEITAAPLADGRVKAKTTADTPEAVYNAWYQSVWEGSGK